MKDEIRTYKDEITIGFKQREEGRERKEEG